MPYQSPYQAPRTWREFLLRVATIAVAALLVLGGYSLFEHFQAPRHSSTRPSPTVPVDRQP